MKTKRRKKWLCGTTAIALCFIITGCGHEHTWAEATCTEPRTCNECKETEGEALGHTWVEATCAEAKHCSKCGETEGEALEHTWVEATCAEAKHCSICGKVEGEALEHTLTEANYQQAATCEVCGETIGEPLQADFEKYEMACNAELDVTRELVAECNDNSDYMTTGTITFSDYDTFESDGTHDALEGYEWKAVTITQVFDDDNAIKYGIRSPGLSFTDYYNMVLAEDDFTVNYNGTDYTELAVNAEILQDGWEDTVNIVNIYQIRVYMRVPVGYDGIVLYTREIANADVPEGCYANELINEHSVLFRLN